MTETLPTVQQPKEIFVLARNPTEMREANAALVVWVNERLRGIEEERSEMQSAYDQAVKAKWRSQPLRRQVLRVEKRLAYYGKIRAALEAGYSIIPNFPVDIFAIRTTRRPVGHRTEDSKKGAWQNTPTLPDQETDAPPLGIGAYVNPGAMETRYEHTFTNAKGEEIVRRTVDADSFADVDFPVAFAKPAIMEAAREAMALKCFDEVGIFKDQAFSRRHGDPMVVGRVRMLGSSYQQTALSFAVAWFLHTEGI